MTDDSKVENTEPMDPSNNAEIPPILSISQLTAMLEDDCHEMALRDRYVSSEDGWRGGLGLRDMLVTLARHGVIERVVTRRWEDTDEEVKELLKQAAGFVASTAEIHERLIADNLIESFLEVEETIEQLGKARARSIENAFKKLSKLALSTSKRFPDQSYLRRKWERLSASVKRQADIAAGKQVDED